MIRSRIATLSLVSTLTLVTAASGQVVVNGDFELSVPSNGTGNGWTSFQIDGAGGWRASGGNPNGWFILNDNGSAGTDPTIQQAITGLTVGAEYLIAGDYVTVFATSGSPIDCFGVLLDGSTILSLDDVRSFTAFSVAFTATSDTQTIAFASERNGSDIAHGIDNISVTLVPTPSAAALALAGLTLLRRRR